MAKPSSFEGLREFFQKGYEAGASFENEEYSFSEDDWGYVHKKTGITVWADPLDLREEGEHDKAGEVLFHFTTPLGYRNITNEAKEKVEVWASLVTEGKGANAYWGKGVYTVPKAPDEWRDREQLLDNNYRSMMKRDLEQYGAAYVEREYHPRVAFCIPIVVNSRMAFDVSVRQTPEMKEQGKPPGLNLNDIELNPPGLPPRVCVVVIRDTEGLQGPSLQRSGSKRLTVRGLNASGSLLERVKSRADSVKAQLGSAPEAMRDVMRAHFRWAVVLLESGHYAKALEVLKEELKRRREVLGKEHIDSLRAMWRFGQILTNLGHFKDAQECELEVLRNLPRTNGAKLERERLRSLASLGAIFTLQHRMRYAEPLFLEAYSGRRASLGPEHFDTLSLLQDLASVSSSLRKHQQAEEYYKEALAGLQHQLGEKHPACLKCQLDLAETLSLQSLHEKYVKSIALYKDTLESLRGQLGEEHPKTKATTSAYLSVLSEHLQIKTAGRVWWQQAMQNGVMNQLPLLFMIAFDFAKALGVLGFLFLALLGVFLYPASWLLVEREAGKNLGPAWLITLAPFVLMAAIFAFLILARRSLGVKVKGKSGRLDPNDMFFLQVLIAILASSILFGLQQYNYYLNTFPPLMVSPWFLFEFYWLQRLCWRWFSDEVTLAAVVEGVFGCFCRVWSAFYLVGWPKPFGPWTVLFCPALLLASVDFLILLYICITNSVGTPLTFAIEVSLSAELRWRITRFLLALLSSILLINYSLHNPKEGSSLTALSLLAVATAPIFALLPVKLQVGRRALRKDRQESWSSKWLGE